MTSICTEARAGARSREIAARAGVDAALVQRYFGTKKRLFEEAIRGTFDATPLLAEAHAESLVSRLAGILLEPTKDRVSFDPTLVVLRSAASQDVRKTLADALEKEFLAPVARALGNNDGAKARATARLPYLPAST